MELPSHPEADDPARAPQPASTPSWPTVVLVGVVVVVLAAMVILHLTGVVGPAD